MIDPHTLEHYPEPFLQSGSGNDNVDIAIMNLINMVKIDETAAGEFADSISSFYNHIRNWNYD